MNQGSNTRGMYMKPYGKYTKLNNVNSKHKDVACIIKKH